MYYLGALWLGALFGWLACSMAIRHKLETENMLLRYQIDQLERLQDGRDIAVSRAYEVGKRDASQRRG